VNHRTRNAFLGLLALALGANLSRAQQVFSFDGGFRQNGGLSLSFQRPWATVDPAGAPSQPDQPRYSNTSLLICSAPNPTTLLDAWHGPMQDVNAGGFDKDGVHRLTVVHLRTAGLVCVYRDANFSQPISATPVGFSGIRQGIPDLSGGTNDYVDSPTSFAVCYGLVVAICEHRQRVTDQSDPDDCWMPVSTSVWCWSEDRGWRPAGGCPVGDGCCLPASDPLHPDLLCNQPGHRRGASWQCQDVCIFDANAGFVSSAYLVASDYALNPGGWGSVTGRPAGGRAFICSLQRSSPTDSMDLADGPTVLLDVAAPADSVPNSPGGFHVHSAHLEPVGDGARLVVPLGDWFTNNRVVTLTRSDRSVMNSGGAILADTNNGWIGHDDLNGSHWLRGPTPPDDPGDASPIGEGNQYVASSPLGPFGQGGTLIGCDESAVCIAKLAPAQPGQENAKLNFTRLFGAGTSSMHGGRRKVFNTFTLSNWDPSATGPYAAIVGSSSEWFSDMAPMVTRVLYSPDGANFGICWAVADAGDRPMAWLQDDSGRRIAFGSSGWNLNGTRSISEPVWRLRRPLAIGAGGGNLLLPQTIHNGAEAFNSVTQLPRDTATLSVFGAPLPPCSGEVFRCRREPTGVGDGKFQMGLWQLTGPTSGKPLSTRLWIFPIACNPNGPNPDVSAVCTPEVDLGDYANMQAAQAFPVGPINTVGDQLGGWFPVTLDVIGNCTGGLGMRLRNRPTWFGDTANDNANPTDFLLALDYVVAGDGPPDHTGASLPPASASLAPEHAVLSGLTTANSPTWTIQLAAMVPNDAWDQTNWDQFPVLGPPLPSLPLCTIRQDDQNDIEVRLLPQRPLMPLVLRPMFLQLVFVQNGRPAAAATADVSAYCLRQSPLLLGLSRAADGSYAAAISVSGAPPVTLATPPTLPPVSPSEIDLFCTDRSAHVNVTPMLWFGGSVDTNSTSKDQIAASLQSLAFLQDPLIACGSADFDGDGAVGTDADIQAFFACLGGDCCPTCLSADFNGDGAVGTDADIESFFRVLGGGPC
jgi:hypothetical protein